MAKANPALTQENVKAEEAVVEEVVVEEVEEATDIEVTELPKGIVRETNMTVVGS